MKQRIHEGDTIIGLHVPISIEKDRLETLLGHNSYRFLWVDSQHAALNEERLVSFCEMASTLDLDVQFRIPDMRQTHLIGRYLDLGPSGVEVPEVESASTVNEAISNFYYPPTGTRSMGGLTRVGLKNHQDPKDYAVWWAKYGVLWIQVESVKSVSDSQKLVKSGVDCLSIGPTDLSFSIAANPNTPFNSVDDCVRHVVDQLKDTTVAVCYRPSNREETQKYADMGVRILLERWNF